MVEIQYGVGVDRSTYLAGTAASNRENLLLSRQALTIPEVLRLLHARPPSTSGVVCSTSTAAMNDLTELRTI